MYNWTRETFCIYRIFASRRTLQAWTPRSPWTAAEFSMLQNCIVAHSAFRWFSKAVGAMHAPRTRSASGFSRAFRETISARREGRCFAIKRIQLTVIAAGIPTFIRDMTSRIVIHSLHSRRRNEIRNACVYELEMLARTKEEDTDFLQCNQTTKNAIDLIDSDVEIVAFLQRAIQLMNQRLKECRHRRLDTNLILHYFK